MMHSTEAKCTDQQRSLGQWISIFLACCPFKQYVKLKFKAQKRGGMDQDFVLHIIILSLSLEVNGTSQTPQIISWIPMSRPPCWEPLLYVIIRLNKTHCNISPATSSIHGALHLFLVISLQEEKIHAN